ncbi:hypothetical protein Egran_02563 [Elaphomyces granulatus]|uniref:Uncharacterized protein n=1 Tax=Elaphomyces granulatus TaxID=519963 RepID=A0A232M018_9EURO|nr:hypothetical protein Egran_02563 [Elaphomyces granulatus]
MFAKKRPTKNTSVSRCTRCSAEICLKTDPKYSDYECEKGATRYYKRVKLAEETEERLNRLVEREETEQVKMTDLEARTLETKRELVIEDGLDEIRTRNARIERNGNAMKEKLKVLTQWDATQLAPEDEEIAKRAFRIYNTSTETNSRPLPMLSFERTNKRKKDAPFALGIKRR